MKSKKQSAAAALWRLGSAILFIVCPLLLAISLSSSPSAQINSQGSTLVTTGTAAPGTCRIGDVFINTSTQAISVCFATNTYTMVTPPVPSGAIFIFLSTCPSGYTEESSLSGKTLFGTVAANGDVGTTGGADSITPAGTNATSTVTPTGTIAWPAGVPSISGIAATFSGNAVAAASTNATPDLVTSNTAGSGVSPVTTATGTVTITNQGTVAWPAGVPTFSGNSNTVGAQTFTGTAFDNRSAFKKVIFCKKD